MSRSHIVNYSLLGLSAVAYVALAYTTPRTEFTQLLLLYTFTFAAYIYVVNNKVNIWHGIAAAIFFRLLFLFAEPALSDDFYRFIWDGRLLHAGINPYLHLPGYFLSAEAPPIAGISRDLFQQLNSQQYYSVYPPVSQAVFWLAAKVSPESIAGSLLTMRLILMLAEIGSMFLLLRLLRKMVLPERHLLLYALNPLVIIELTGNLHFEALMIFFLLLMLYQLFYQRLVISGVALGMAIGTKLLPLMFLPFLLRRLGFRKFLLFIGATLATLLAVFYPLASLDVINNIFQSIDLYFQRFEFNASVYYLLRWFGFRFTGYNQIAILGPALSVVTFIVIIAMAFVKKLGSIRRLSGYMAAALTVYLFLATTVHPWYVCTILALTTMSMFRYAIVWSGLAILSYATYRTSTYQEDLTLVTLEYALVFLWLVAELYLYRQRHNVKNMES
ncbi:glycosyltransferase 87 family protein [Pontibacter locisalis]|uniref:Glycosyltransferase 87 family protein n=1 Tax=Pontibacter locisalis TaxID=1719035 RepID=A0ABW5IKK5_9BACT